MPIPFPITFWGAPGGAGPTPIEETLFGSQMAVKTATSAVTTVAKAQANAGALSDVASKAATARPQRTKAAADTLFGSQTAVKTATSSVTTVNKTQSNAGLLGESTSKASSPGGGGGGDTYPAPSLTIQANGTKSVTVSWTPTTPPKIKVEWTQPDGTVTTQTFFASVGSSNYFLPDGMNSWRAMFLDDAGADASPWSTTKTYDTGTGGA